MTWFRCGGIPQSVLNMKTVSSASGSIATFDTDLTDNLVKCVANIQAVQSGSGTPSPSNVRAISGWQNVNVVKFAVTGNIPSDIRVYDRWLNQNTNKWAGSSNAKSIAIPCSPNTTYTITGYDNDLTAYKFATIRISTLPDDNATQYDIYQLAYFTSYSEVGKAYTFTTDSQATFIVIQQSPQGMEDLIANGTVAPSTLVTIALGQTVYGGYLDVTSGVLTITHAYYDLANYTGNVQKVTMSSYPERTYFRFDDLTPYPLITEGELICDKYEKKSITTTTDDIGVGLGNPSALGHSTVYLRPENPNSYTTSTIMTFIQNTLGGLQIVYKLQEANYIKVQLTSNQIVTILGQNNIYADTGDIEVEFLETVGNKIGG